MSNKKLTAIEKSERALKILKDERWIEDFGIFEQSSLEDQAGRDVWVTYKYNGRKIGRFAFQILRSSAQGEKHEERHNGVPHLAIVKGDTIQFTRDKHLLFLHVHRALNREKIKGLKKGMSLLCPYKCASVKFEDGDSYY
jgi:hypothetical protein